MLRLGIAGCGRQAERGHVPAAERADGVELVAVADADPSRCARAAPGIPAFDSVEALLRQPLDAVVVATPTSDHLGTARLVAESGRPALVEKPPAPDAEQAAALAALGAPVWIGFNRRFDPDLEAIREGLADEPAVTLRLRLDFPVRLWRPHVAHDDALLNLGTHLIDMARWLLRSDVSRIRAAAVSPARASLELDLGPHRATLDCATNRFWREQVIAEGGSGSLADHRRGGVARVGLAKLRLAPRDDGFVISLSRQLEELARETRGAGSGRLAGVADGVAALSVAEAARSAA